MMKLLQSLRWMLFGAEATSGDLSPAAALQLLEKEKGSGRLVVLDVRTPKEFAEARLEGGVNLDFYLGDFREKLAALDKGKTYLVHCAVGGRSGKAVGMMKELGFPKAYNLQGGIKAWIEQGLPTQR